MLKLLIVDGAEDFRTTLAESLKGTYAVRTCTDGETALEAARSFLPDILILDLTVAGMDGLSLVQLIAENHSKPITLATTRFISDYVLEAATRIGIDYMMVKPCNIRAVSSRIADLVASRKPKELTLHDRRTAVANLLLVMGFSTNCKGYNYLREAIPAYAKDPGQAMTKELYPTVAKLYGASALQVERAMRTAIEKAWKRRDDQIWKLYFTPLTDGNIPKPCNSEFISRLADMLIRQRNEA